MRETRAGEPPRWSTTLGSSSHVDDRSGVLNEYQRRIIFRLGRAVTKPKGQGLIMVFQLDRMTRIDLRTDAASVLLTVRFF
jgi:hypothetical protein